MDVFEVILLLLFHPKNSLLHLYKIFNLDAFTNENNKEHNFKWPYIPDHLYRMLIIGGSGPEKANALLNLIKKQDSGNLIEKIYLHAKDLNERKYQF